MDGMTDPTFFEHVLESYADKRVAVDAGFRTYTGRLTFYGEVIGIQQDDRTWAWIRARDVHALRVFPSNGMA